MVPGPHKSRSLFLGLLALHAGGEALSSFPTQACSIAMYQHPPPPTPFEYPGSALNILTLYMHAAVRESNLHSSVTKKICVKPRQNNYLHTQSSNVHCYVGFVHMANDFRCIHVLYTFSNALISCSRLLCSIQSLLWYSMHKLSVLTSTNLGIV